MATAKIVTWSRPDKNGQYPIGIKIWNNGKPSYIFDGHTLPSRDLWDAKKQEVKKSFPNAARLTNLLSKKLVEARDKALQMENAAPKVLAIDIKKDILNRQDQTVQIFFDDIAKEYLNEQLDCGNADVHSTDNSRLKRFYEFSKGGKVLFSDITDEYLRRYTVYLSKDVKRNGNSKTLRKPLSERTIINHLLIIRTLWNRAIASGVIKKDNYPFGTNGKISIKFPESSKIGLNEDELSNLECIDLSAKPALDHARNVCLLSFYFAGMRITDTLLLKWTDFHDNRLFYKMSKNGEPGSLKIPSKALAILEQYKYKQHSYNLVFPDLNRVTNLSNKIELRHEINLAENRINKSMKKVMKLMGCNKNASPHKFRHAFAQLAEEKNVHPKVLQKMYRHESILTTMKYQSNFSYQKADAALDTVLDF
jgi:integrase